MGNLGSYFSFLLHDCDRTTFVHGNFNSDEQENCGHSKEIKLPLT